MVLDHLRHQRSDGVGIQGLPPFADEDQAAAIDPSGTGCGSLLSLSPEMLPERGDGVTIDADHAGSAALGRAFDPVSPNDSRRAAKGDLARIKIKR
jgi:hypothetical protein